MGCDIHIFVEKKENNEWKPVKGVNMPDYYYYQQRAREGNKWAEQEFERIKDGHYKDWIYSGRNYNLFSILADVRNGYGFAGIITGGRFNVIKEPQGLPDDVSNLVKNDYEEWGCDAHSASYLTLNDLLKFNWLQGNWHQGYIALTDYEEFKMNGKPDQWSGDVSARDIKKITRSEAERFLKGEFALEEDKRYFVLADWKETYYDSTSHFCDYSIEEMITLSDDIDFHDVRIVFWFDN